MTSSPVEIGSTIAGKYRVERVLGQGGMGVVVVAMHDELDQRVAIKFLLRESMSDPEWVARFAREAKAATRIKSEHAVKVYDVGKLDNGAPYMVMEYLEGRDLQTILNERRCIPVEEAVEYLLQACEAIAEAHGAGVVHRDLKPANLFVTHRTDGSPCVKILDFGISKVTSLTGADNQAMTNTSAIVGSPLYMSPEQMRASKNVDRRTDIWSLGVILQELVSGLPSFVANTTAELCALVLTAPPSPLDARDAPRGLGDVIAKCLKKTPDERYATIADFARALEPFGPSSVKTSVERIVRLSASRGGPRSLTSEAQPKSPSASDAHSPVSIVPEGQTSANVSSLGRTEMSSSDPALLRTVSPSTSVGAPSPGSGTAAAWGSSRAQPKMSRLPVVIAASAIAAIGLLAIIVAVTRTNSPGAAHSSEPTAASHVHTDEPVQPPPPATTVAAIATQPTATATQVAPVVTTAPPVVTPAITAHAATPPTSTVKPAPTTSGKHVAPVDTTGFGGRN